MFLWLPFLSYVLIMAYTPGPNNIMSMNNAAALGFKRALPFNLGIFAGFFIVMLLCMAFSTALFAIIPQIEFPMKIVGAAYMLYLIWKIIKPYFSPAEEHKVKDAGGSFFLGATLQFINVKIMIYGITAMTSYILPHYKNMVVLIAFAFFLAFAGFIATVCWSAFGTLFSKLFSKHGLMMSIIMSALLVYCAVSLFL